MQHHSTALQESSEEQFRELRDSGVLNALFQAQLMGCAKHYDGAPSRFEHQFISGRASGDDRWHHVDSEILHVANRFNMTMYWVQPSSNSKIKLLFLKHQDILLSTHQVTGYGSPAQFAWHREKIKAVQAGLFPASELDVQMALQQGPVPVGPDQFLCKPEYLKALVHDEEAPLSYWMYTYQRTHERVPRWSVLGRPVRGERKLLCQRDVMKILKYIHPSETTIELNPDPGTPPTPNFGLPKRDRQGGEGED